MTRKEAIKELQESHDTMRSYDIDENESRLMTALNMAIQALSQEPTEKPMCDRNICISNEYNGIGCDECVVNKPQEPCDDAISREVVMRLIENKPYDWSTLTERHNMLMEIRKLPSVTQKSGKCKNCNYFEYDSVAKVDGIPLIVAHEICNKWGNGCKTSEDGYCYLFEPRESEDKE